MLIFNWKFRFASNKTEKYHKSIDKSLCFVQYKENLYKNTKIRVVELISTKRKFFQKKLKIPSFEFQVGWHGFVDKKNLICMVWVQSTVLQIKSNKDTYMNIVQTVSMYMYIELIRFMCHYIDFNNSTHSKQVDLNQKHKSVNWLKYHKTLWEFKFLTMLCCHKAIPLDKWVFWI